MAKPHGATPALRALDLAGVSYRVHEYVHDPRATSFGLEAAAALGMPAARVFKTLLASDGA
ncbi:MAG TPA: Cys-tRNA(Pro) deacylase, partial [Arachnia sp.]|nr:Cys-tRNA(Pro) deacylase [Arachnia sp.]